MLYRYILIMAFCLTINCVHAQIIKPTELLQIYQYALIKEAPFGISAFKYIASMDKRWEIDSNLTKDNNGIAADYSFTMDFKSWYQPEAYHIMIHQEYGPPETRSVTYMFKELETWNSYLKQMLDMNASKLDTRGNLGGLQTIYTVNDINFIFIDFPPGLHGADRTYEITIMHTDKQNH